LSAEIYTLQHRKHELSTEGETFITCSTVTAVTADRHSLTDTAGTDCDCYSCEQMLLAGRSNVSKAATGGTAVRVSEYSWRSGTRTKIFDQTGTNYSNINNYAAIV
jgi:hypothetical protein